MLEKLPASLGRALRGARAGMTEIIAGDTMLADLPVRLRLTSPAFPEGGAIPPRYTADDAGISPPLDWAGLLPAAAASVLIV